MKILRRCLIRGIGLLVSWIKRMGSNDDDGMESIYYVEVVGDEWSNERKRER